MKATQSKTLSTYFPSWNSLTATVDANPHLSRKVQAAKSKQPQLLLKMARNLGKTVVRDPAVQRYCSFSWDEIVDIIADQVARNHAVPSNRAGAEALRPTLGKGPDRGYSQLPCTQGTAENRVAVAKRLVAREEPVLLLGDDDQVSLELLSAGYRDVTVVDICPNVLAGLKERRPKQAGLKLVQHDLSQPAPAALKRPYKLVFMDPIYSLEGVDMFLRSALTMLAPGTECQIVLCVHLMSLSEAGLSALEELFRSVNVELLEFMGGFNAYPIPKKTRFMLSFMNRLLRTSGTLPLKGDSLSLFFSDALLLKKNA